MNSPISRASRRLIREKNTVRAMIEIYCRGNHSAKSGDALCPECQSLLDYAIERLDRCPFGENKTACAKCPVHCYKPSLRERIKAVMRYAGPRMLWKHPIMAFMHQFDGLRTKKSNRPQEK